MSREIFAMSDDAAFSTYTLDKKVESLVKTALPIAHSPTVVSPEQYSRRFYDAIDNYFAMSPDQWTSSDPLLD